MFDDNDELKRKLRDFINDEIEELQQHKLRFLALFFSLLLSIALIFTEDSAETIEITGTSQIEETSDNSNEENVKNDKKTSNKKVISVKKDSNKSEREKVVAVLGANSDELYIGDPFQSYEETPPKVQPKNSEVSTIPQQIPIIPSQLSPLPDQIQNLPPIPSMIPQVSEPVMDPTNTVEKEFILTGTAINSNKKSAVVQKISTAQGQNKRVENLILNVGDSLEGHQIVDITPSAVLFDDGHRINSNYLGSDISIYTDEKDIEIDDVPENYSEIPMNPVIILDSDIPIIPDSVVEYNNFSSDKDGFKIPDIAAENDTVFEDNQSLIQIDEKKLDLNSDTADKITESGTNITNDNFLVEDNLNVSADSDDVPFNLQGDSLVSGNNSP